MFPWPRPPTDAGRCAATGRRWTLGGGSPTTPAHSCLMQRLGTRLLRERRRGVVHGARRLRICDTPPVPTQIGWSRTVGTRPPGSHREGDKSQTPRAAAPAAGAIRAIRRRQPNDATRSVHTSESTTCQLIQLWNRRDGEL